MQQFNKASAALVAAALVQAVMVFTPLGEELANSIEVVLTAAIMAVVVYVVPNRA